MASFLARARAGSSQLCAAPIRGYRQNIPMCGKISGALGTTGAWAYEREDEAPPSRAGACPRARPSARLVPDRARLVPA